MGLDPTQNPDCIRFVTRRFETVNRNCVARAARFDPDWSGGRDVCAAHLAAADAVRDRDGPVAQSR